MAKVGAGFLMVTATVFTMGACAGANDEAATPLPSQIHGLELQATHAGAEAARILEGLHGKPVGAEQSWVGIYGPMEMASALYLSRYESAEVAQTDFDRMVAGIDAGTAQFGHHTWFNRSGHMVHSAFGQGGINYFWMDGTDIWWLGVYPPIARMAVAELLGIPGDSIPQLGLPTLEEAPATP